MTVISSGWGAGPSTRHAELSARFQPLFERIREGAIEREVQRRLPVEELGWLKAAGFTALRLPVEHGGAGVTLPELFALLIELGEADSNLVQAVRGHMGFVEGLLNSDDQDRRIRWFARIAAGETIGPASSEVGDARRAEFSTRLRRDGDHLLLSGTKFYTTGSLYADWIDVGATDEAGNRVMATVRRAAPGVEVVDDWNGFGQTLTASGTATFTNVRVAPADVVAVGERFRYSPGFFQVFHLANLAGMGRAMSSEVAAAVAARTRTFTIGNADRVSQDPQVLAVVGQVRSAAYCAGVITLKNAEALQRVYDLRHADDQAAEDRAVDLAELEVCQSLNVVTDLIIDASGRLFDALGASATLRPQGLDRFWRNARTLASHNPRIYKDRIVGDYAVNGTPPPPQWKIGVA
ncbi:acyl-CoA dehydrogenase family protein [Pseudomonas oryzihabitans]|uniref:acyl-CoA dehydrogenase family protein n=1 Tax=Pseudomonas oryzihabitans TaxID=47885 RepID=UPI0028613A24|nr:acyl-CoA dehydrogenase family protein [Pseudomonas psychrotolerans]MDR6680555.1 alkylation response protein AidB-like acyl-CoA dehydrogenase [Pseudomonas psychrotolerans]